MRLQPRRLSTRIIVSFVALLALVQAAAFVLVDAANRRNAERKVDEELAVGERIFARLLDAQREQLTQAARVLTADFALREAVATNDVATIESALDNHGERVQAAVALLVDPRGQVVAEARSASPSSAMRAVRGQPFPFTSLFDRARQEGTAAGIVLFDGHAYQLVLVPVRAPLLVGWVALGFELNDAVMAELRELTALQVSVFALEPAGPRPLASTLAPPLRAELAATLVTQSAPASGAITVRLGGDEYAGRRIGLAQQGEARVVAVVQRSIDEVVAAFNRLQVFLVLLGAFSVPLAAGASWLIARGITRPLSDLAGSTARIRAGDYSQPVRIAGSDEVVALAGSVNHMQEAIAQREREVLRLAYEDTLTALPNRARFLQSLREQIGGGAPLAVLMLDLDRFKAVNDALGHAAGDEVLRQVGARLAAAAASMGDAALVARLGGDEFAVMLPGADVAAARQHAEALLGALSDPVVYQGQPIDVSAACGLACVPVHGEDAGTVLRHADIALYASKRQGGGPSVYDPEHDRVRSAHLSLLGELRRAIDEDQLLLHFQPKLDLNSGLAKGAEALVRWQHPQRGMVPPGEFMPWAETTGFVRQVTDWVLAAALRQAGAWCAQGRPVSLAVNISARDLIDEGLARRVASLLREHAVAPEAICLEITESSVMDDPRRGLETLAQLDALGVRLAIDDFGTGFSSLAYLQKLPVDELKIDRSFVQALRSEQRGGDSIVRSTIQLAHNLGLQVVAEGIEDEPTLARLRELGCDQAQGYFISGPLPAPAFEAWLQARAAAIA